MLFHGTNMIDENIVNKKILERQNRIKTYATANNMSTLAAAIFIDQNSPLTTNKDMFKLCGFDIDVVTKDNFREVIDAYDKINVTILTDGCDEDRIISVLNKTINETITECWGGPDMREFIECFPEPEIV